LFAALSGLWRRVWLPLAALRRGAPSPELVPHELVPGGAGRSRNDPWGSWRRSGAAVFATAAALTCNDSAALAEPALRPYVVVGDAIPASLTGMLGDPVKGKAIVTSRQTGLCLLCHSAPLTEEKFQGTIGPDLKGAGSRYTAGQLRLRIVDSSRINPDSIMPAYYRLDGLERVAPAFRGKTVLTAEQIEDVIAFIMTLREDTRQP
jgi:L-cysteine S-thiosulfotransferase